MNSSGIKRGLAAGAISALAVTGLPFFASSASAAVGDVIKVASVGPALNGGGPGAQILVQVTKGSVATPADLKVIGSDLTSTPKTPNQDVVEGTPVAAPTDSNPKDDLDEYIVPVTVTTSQAGDTAKFAIYNDSANPGVVDAGEARTPASVTTAGAVKSIDLSPTSQTTSTGQDGTYTATLKDSAGHLTQLATGDSLNITADNGATPTPSSLSSSDLALGTHDFAVTGGPAGKTTVTVTDAKDAAIKQVATLQVAPAAVLDADNVDVVSGADSWDGFGGDSSVNAIRVDQSSLRLDFQGTKTNANKDAVAILTVSRKSGNVSFDGGESSTKVTTTLDANGIGSVPVTADAGTIRDGDVINIKGDGFDQDFVFQKAAPTAINADSPYFGAFGGSLTVDANVLDQFGQPVTSGYVTAARTGANTDSTPQKQNVGPNGKVSFTFTDTKAKDAVTPLDVVTFTHYADQYTTVAGPSKTVKLNWTKDGKGKDFSTDVNGADTSATTYDPSKNSIIPLTDAVANSNTSSRDEFAELAVSGAEADQPITVSADNGALILKSTDSKLSQGVSSIDAVTDGFGALNGYEIVGTKSGLVTVTISSANRTETEQFTVAKQTESDTARNVAVSGPAEVESGATQIAYTAIVTDAFGNPVPGVYVGDLNIQVTGPAQFQDGDVVTNAAGQLALNVRVDSDAVGPVSIKATGLPWRGQFGAAADHLWSDSPTKDGEGLPASSNVGTASTMVKAVEVPPVDDINLVLNGTSNGAADDVLKANASKKANGLVATLYKHTANGWQQVTSAALNAKGNHKFKVADTNGNKNKKYQVRVDASDVNNTAAAKANKKVR